MQFVFGQTTITMQKDGGVYVIPCKVNGLNLKFIFDTGASNVCISLTEALFMLKNDYLKESDITGTSYAQIANGDITENTKIVLRKVEFAGLTLNNVEASVVHELSAPLLFGQSAISKLGTIQLDPAKRTLTIIGNETNANPRTEYSKRNSVDFRVEKVTPELKIYIWHGDIGSETKLKENEKYGIRCRLYNDNETTILNDFGYRIAPIDRATFGCMYSAILKLVPGDSAIFRVLVDSIFGKNPPPILKKDKYVKFSYVIGNKKQEEDLNHKPNQSTLVNADDDILIKYFVDNNIAPLRTLDGLYYVINRLGVGSNPKSGQVVVANYTGKFLDGTVFDSNQLERFNHQKPFEFKFGTGQVIQGWEKGFEVLNKGAKATLYIPSRLAYGERGAGELIKPNDCLIFDIELVDIKP
jgi:clan AA aspartic protease (TIGR02281 family)